jgi:uncharacterized protein YuzE
MDVKVSATADVAYIRLGQAAEVARSVEVAPGIVVDFDASGDAVGIEVLGLRRRGMDAATVTVSVEAGVAEELAPEHPLARAVTDRAARERAS